MRNTLILTLALVWSTGCASVPLKQKVSEAHQTVRQALVAIDDAEVAACQPSGDAPNHCTSPAAATIGLTDAKHQQLSRLLADAFDKDAKVSAALIAWKAGDPMPTDLPTLLADANGALTVAQSFAPSSPILAKVQSLLSALTQLQTVLGGGK